jgi:predicted hydrocarbon binding protein
LVLLPRSSENPRPFVHTVPGVLSSVRDSRRVVAVDIGVWASICKQIYSCDSFSAPIVMDDTGWRFGADLASREQREHPFAEDSMADIAASLSEMGWGQFLFDSDRMKSFTSKKSDRLSFRIKGSAFAQLNLGGGSPLCHFTVGLLKGTLSVLQGEQLRAWQELCAAKGDGVCEIVVARR